ncbi:MAG: hypothetical protein GC171_15045 [Terrimonas sp.]|nr:hypothetical protein [Terrimonas sp.]
MKTVTKSLIVFLLLIVTGCSTTRIVSSWKNPVATTPSFNKILVVGLMSETNRVLREKMENHLVADLRSRGYDASCSCEEFGPKIFEHLSENEAIDKIRNSGYDAVLTIVLLDKTKERYYQPGRVYYSPYVVYQHRFWGYYTTIYDRVYTPGYYQTNTKYFWESNLYELNNNKELLYSVQTESFDPASASSMADEYGKLIVGDLVKNDILNTPTPVKTF